ncbi:MAG: signal peptidase I [Parasporobacterium sp.]|nr:signal peptidase I [Parasporobacterium sp.]
MEELENGEKQNKEEGKKKMNPVIEWVVIIAVALAAALFINFVIIINSVVPSGSMESTIMTNSRMMGLRASYWFSDPQQGDIIVFKYPDDPSENFVKRVIGTPGDTVEIIGGVTYVNGEVLDEPYLNETPRNKDFGPYIVPEESYFVMGDNRNNSHDSRYWHNTFVPRSSVLGKALFCYWPPNRIGVLK